MEKDWMMIVDYHRRNMTAPHPWLGMRPWRRHSLVLMIAGLVYVGIGFSFIVAEPSPGRAQALVIALTWMPLKAWGVVFMLAGALSIMSSRWPPISKTWGYMVLTGLSAGWGACYVTAVFIKDSPSGNLAGGGTWGLIAFLWWAISGLINADDVAITLPIQESIRLHGQG